MYTLRIVRKNGVAQSIYLGSEYWEVNKERSAESFSETEKSHKAQLEESCTGFVISCSGESFPVFSENNNFIMANGTTIHKL